MNRFAKLAKILRHPRFAMVLARHGVAAGVDNLEFLTRHRFATIFDVGANRGQFCLAASDVQPDARIYSFEPLHPAATLFRAVLGTDPDVTLYETALGAAKGIEAIRIPGNDDEASLALDLEGAVESTVSIDTLDNLFGDVVFARPALLKIDVQGFEMSVLQGAEKTLARIDDLYVEVTFEKCGPRHSPARDVVEWLRQRGFSVAGVYNPVGYGKPWHGCDMHFRRV